MAVEANHLKKHHLTQFLAKNKARVIFYGILLVVLIVSCIYLFKMNYQFVKSHAASQEAKDTTSQTAVPGDKPSAGGSVSTYLPETRRTTESGAEIRDPFNKSMVLKGVITGGGKNLAIIEFGNTAIIATEGDEIDGGWTVQEINKNTVIVTLGEQKTELKLTGR